MSRTKASFQAALGDEAKGSWGASLYTDQNGHFKSVFVFWSAPNDGAKLDWAIAAGSGGLTYRGKSYTGTNHVEIRCKQFEYGTGGSSPVVIPREYNGASTARISEDTGNYRNLFIFNVDTNYPPGYEGTLVRTLDDEQDADEDGLDVRGEVLQGTSYFKKNNASD